MRQIEFSYGAAASLYGPDAIGGIVNVVTESAADGNHASTEAWFGAGSEATYEAQARHRFDITSGVALLLTGAYYTSSQEDLSAADLWRIEFRGPIRIVMGPATRCRRP